MTSVQVFEKTNGNRSHNRHPGSWMEGKLAYSLNTQAQSPPRMCVSRLTAGYKRNPIRRTAAEFGMDATPAAMSANL
jgi:hypothetical protein